MAQAIGQPQIVLTQSSAEKQASKIIFKPEPRSSLGFRRQTFPSLLNGVGGYEDAGWEKRKMRLGSFSVAQNELRNIKQAGMTTSDKLIEISRRFRSVLTSQRVLENHRSRSRNGTIVHRSAAGCRLIDWILKWSKKIVLRKEALEILQVLVEEGIIRNALVAERGFSDDDSSFYVFVDVPHTLPPVPSYDDPSAIDDGHQLQEDFDFLECLVVGMQLKNELRKPSSERDNRLIMEIISRIPRFRSESVSVKELTASSMSFKAIEKAGEIVFKEGDPADSYYVIIKGSVEVVKRKRGTIAVLREGDEFGEWALISKSSRAATIRTRERNCYFMTLSKTQFAAIHLNVETSTIRLREHESVVLVLRSTATHHNKVISGTLDKLQEILVEPDLKLKVDEGVLEETFFLLIPSRLQVHEFILKFDEIYRKNKNNVIVKQRIADVLGRWVHQFAFTKKEFNLMAPYLAILLNRMKSDGIVNSTLIPSPGKPIRLRLISPESTLKANDLRSWNDLKRMYPIDIAVEITASDTLLLDSREVRHFIESVMERKLTTACRFGLVLRRLNDIMLWVKTRITERPTMRGKLKAFSYFIRLAQRCWDLCNFNAFAATVLALQDSSVKAEDSLWKKILKRYGRHLNELELKMDPSFNFRSYRKAQENAAGVVIPFIPLVLKDLTFIRDGNVSQVEEMINFERIEMVLKTIKLFEKIRDNV
ncbi:rap guanine nucleotide exchange factor 4-like isoform X3 [Oscarella lobularis]|uniref:rap guanine nucleotide exchange factor 4-like isoform X3 n=1 Tax=Oscarella lobularis TaxID=121494 RepID=UPI003314306E